MVSGCWRLATGTLNHSPHVIDINVECKHWSIAQFLRFPSKRTIMSETRSMLDIIRIRTELHWQSIYFEQLHDIKIPCLLRYCIKWPFFCMPDIVLTYLQVSFQVEPLFSSCFRQPLLRRSLFYGFVMYSCISSRLSPDLFHISYLLRPSRRFPDYASGSVKCLGKMKRNSKSCYDNQVVHVDT